MRIFKPALKFEELIQRSLWNKFETPHLLENFIQGEFIERLQETKQINVLLEYYRFENNRLRLIGYEEGFSSHKFEFIWFVNDLKLNSESEILEFILENPSSLGVSYEQILI